MCDTFYISSKISEDGSNIFCKNSDRPYGESQAIMLLPPEKRSDTIKATYIKIKGKDRKYSVFIGKPFWMWGGEFAINSAGVCIGNEALFTKIKIKGNNGLLGMDTLRFSAEISGSAEESLQNIIELIERYGQDANSAYDKDFRYHNSFLILDTDKVFYVETVGRNYAFREIKDDFFSISNKMIICGDSNGTLSCPKKYERKIYSFLAGGKQRREKIIKEIQRKVDNGKKISLKDCIEILKIHGFGTRSVCMHYGIFCPSQTANSVICLVHNDGNIVIWATGTPHPCISVFKPFVFGTQVPYSEIFLPSGKKDSSLWWISITLHQKLFKDKKMLKDYRENIEDLQEKIIRIYKEVHSDKKSVYELLEQSINWELKVIKKYSKADYF
ncbi:MAG: hypothetical protein NZ927_00285 [Candidatus Calescibacterium sp.]|nr:hypothetical protein [Candidatus Calescibacterium sp.]MCX7733808.1 hypothetical protein [bacterium]MDW8086986.1 hypothetical protein [Candidatus Calescibacterium sp.]